MSSAFTKERGNTSAPALKGAVCFGGRGRANAPRRPPSVRGNGQGLSCAEAGDVPYRGAAFHLRPSRPASRALRRGLPGPAFRVEYCPFGGMEWICGGIFSARMRNSVWAVAHEEGTTRLGFM